jgi:hypothetical protein
MKSNQRDIRSASETPPTTPHRHSQSTVSLEIGPPLAL